MSDTPDLLRPNKGLGGAIGVALRAVKLREQPAHLGVLALWTAKATKTHKAIVLLCEHGYGEDGAVLVRSLLNLVVNAMWLLQDPETRSQMLTDYDWVRRAKLSRKVLANPALLGHLAERIVQHKETAHELEARAEEARRKHGWKKDAWSGKTIREMAKEVGLENAYDTAYTLISSVEHSDARSLDAYMGEDARGPVVNTEPGPHYVEESLLTAHHLLLLIAEEADQKLSLGLREPLRRAREWEKQYAEEEWQCSRS